MAVGNRSQILATFVLFALLAGVLIALSNFDEPLIEYVSGFFVAGRPRAMARDNTEGFLRVAKIFLWMALVVLAVRFFNRLVFERALRPKSGENASSLLRNVFSIAVYIVAFFVVFKSQYPTVDLAALLTTSAILGVILGLALQDTLGNLFAGLSLQADAPFAVGDVVTIPTKGAGVVENITWRGVKIRTFQNKLLVISNTVIGKEAIEVAPRDNLNARIVNFSTVYTDSPTNTIHVVRQTVAEADNVSSKFKPVVRIRDFTERGLEWEVKYWLEDYTRFNDTDALVRQRIWYAFRRESITFATQQINVNIARRPRKSKQQDETEQIFERLSAIEIFEPLSDEETLRLAKATQRRTFAPKEIIIRAGDAGESMFVINRGSVRVQIPDLTGNNNEMTELAALGEGKFFGEMALLTGEPRTATVSAIEETEVFEIGHAAIKTLFESNPYLAEALSEAIAERRALLSELHENAAETTLEEHRRGVFAGIKHFFGLN